ncbi:uncharacterized protein BDZ99DRAFT_466416 [Mytilinidion resinicola]|uniref:Mg2+ transporter protein n=1 Tax=Mytilinidion resinicola TaxID=574789 RepID=A0A6A6Y9A3_9PEZI|nr:uncharacterized protein BDZ99DRAFT_466416 [Mytilinidion resinicola]KAF2805401.1 hypothetical protein BDZ99DRAFT_466416 [Mytilinidion resinicola]
MALGYRFKSSSAPNRGKIYLKQAPSASLLHKQYGRSLLPNVMASDAFYALNEIFSLAASSEMQFLNFVDVKLDRYTHPDIDITQSSQNVIYTKRILSRHMQNLKQTLQSIRNTTHPKWPKARGDEAKVAKAAAERLQNDFEYLINRAQMLDRRCAEIMTILQNSISLSESWKAMEHTQQLMRLSRLAFVFIPVSFSIFLMALNLKDFTHDRRLYNSWWMGLTVVMIILESTALLVFMEGPRLSKALRNLWSKKN